MEEVKSQKQPSLADISTVIGLFSVAIVILANLLALLPQSGNVVFDKMTKIYGSPSAKHYLHSIVFYCVMFSSTLFFIEFFVFIVKIIKKVKYDFSNYLILFKKYAKIILALTILLLAILLYIYSEAYIVLLFIVSCIVASFESIKYEIKFFMCMFINTILVGVILFSYFFMAYKDTFTVVVITDVQSFEKIDQKTIKSVRGDFFTVSDALGGYRDLPLSSIKQIIRVDMNRPALPGTNDSTIHPTP